MLVSERKVPYERLDFLSFALDARGRSDVTESMIFAPVRKSLSPEWERAGVRAFYQGKE